MFTVQYAVHYLLAQSLLPDSDILQSIMYDQQSMRTAN